MVCTMISNDLYPWIQQYCGLWQLFYSRYHDHSVQHSWQTVVLFVYTTVGATNLLDRESSTNIGYTTSTSGISDLHHECEARVVQWLIPRVGVV